MMADSGMHAQSCGQWFPFSCMYCYKHVTLNDWNCITAIEPGSKFAGINLFMPGSVTGAQCCSICDLFTIFKLVLLLLVYDPC